MIEMRLHAILGKSRLHLASAIIAVKWERVILYGSDEDEFNRFTKGLMGLIRSRIDRTNQLSFDLLDKLEFVRIPSLDRRENDMLSMIGSLRSRLRELEGPIDGSDVLFYSGTKPHLFLFVSERGFRRIISFKGEALEIHSTEDVNKGKETMKLPIPKWDEESLLRIHGLSISDGWIVDSDTGESPIIDGAGKQPPPYSLEMDQRSKSRIRVVWKKPETSGDVKRFCLHVTKYNQALAGSVIHEVPDEHLRNWCRNTHLPPPIAEEPPIDFYEGE